MTGSAADVAGPGVVSGLVIVDKPAGMTSHDVVAKVRRLAKTKKVGHAGTLDPMATGVLVLGINKATRLLGHLALTEKAYDATIRLGLSKTTDDADGEDVVTTDASAVTGDQIAAVLASFVGDIEQVPSSVSAIKINGERAYKRVRAGEQVELPARPVTIHEIVLEAVSRPSEPTGVVDVKVSVRCSSGTYIRAIARDLGAALGVGGHLTALRRTAVGSATLAEATPLQEMLDQDAVTVLGMAEIAARFFPTITVDAEGEREVGYGRSLAREFESTGPVAVLGPDGDFLALYERAEGQSPATAKPVAVFL